MRISYPRFDANQVQVDLRHMSNDMLTNSTSCFLAIEWMRAFPIKHVYLEELSRSSFQTSFFIVISITFESVNI